MTTRISWCLILAVWGLVGGLAHAADAPKFRTSAEAVLNLYWTDTPPALDGKRDDACWQTAEVAKDFVLFKCVGLPLNQTEVRLAYDAQNLYVFWTMYETKLDLLKEGTPDQRRDRFRFQDVGELFLDPGRTETHYYQLASNPSAQLYDGAYGFPNATIYGFSPAWQVVSGRLPNGWTLEEKIPFAELALGGMLVGTPQVGDHWGLGLCRDEDANQELSQWVPTDQGFHAPKQWGHLYFRGRRDGAALPAVSQARPGALFYGPDALEFTVKGAAALQATATLQMGEKTPADLPAVVAGNTVRIPYQLLEGGVTKFAFKLSDAGRVFYTGGAVADQPVIRAPLETMAAQASADQAALAKLGTPHPTMRMVAWRLNGFLQKVQEAQAQLDQGAALTAPQWQALIDDTQVLQDHWHKLQFDIALAKIYPGKPGQPPVAFAVGSGTESDKFYRDLPCAGPTSGPIRLALAGNEYGSYQLAVMPFWRDLDTVNVTCSALSGPGGRLPAEASRWFRVTYVKLAGWDPGDPGRPYEPDPLMPAAPFAVPQGEQAAVWVDFQLPAGTPAGVYQGTVTVSADGQSVVRPVEVRARGFDLPRVSSFEADTGFGLYIWNWFYQGLKYTPEMHARHAAVMGRYRVNTLPGDWITICPQVPIYREADGHFSFDFTVFDQYVKNGLANGSHAWSCSAQSGNSGWAAWLNSPSREIIDRATGQKHTLKEYFQPPTWNWSDPACFRNNPLYREFLPIWVEHLKELGVSEFSYWEQFDEPSDKSRWRAMIEHHKFFREVAPGLKTIDFGVDPTRSMGGEDALGLMDAWAPHLTYITPEMDALIKERRAKYGEKYWGYTCGEGDDGQGNYSPYIRYDRPYLSARMHYWFTWKHQMDGLLVFSSMSVPGSNLRKAPEVRWPNSDWSDDGARGCGTLVYPGPDYELIPGMRLANIRKGLEDQEYFILLRKLSAGLDPAQHAALLARVNQALLVEPEIMADIYHWTKDPARLEAKRDRIAALITEITKRN